MRNIKFNENTLGNFRVEYKNVVQEIKEVFNEEGIENYFIEKKEEIEEFFYLFLWELRNDYLPLIDNGQKVSIDFCCSKFLTDLKNENLFN